VKEQEQSRSGSLFGFQMRMFPTLSDLRLDSVSKGFCSKILGS